MDVAPVEDDDAGETEEDWEPKLQEADEHQEHVNSLYGKEIL